MLNVSRSTLCLGIRRLHTTTRRLSDSVLRADEHDALDKWVQTPPVHHTVDPLTIQHTGDLYVTLPTRDGTHTEYQAPETGEPLPYGHHLAFFGARRPEPLLRADGTDEDISPPAPFTKRMWVGGKIRWNPDAVLRIGQPATAKSTLLSVDKKGWDKGKPMLFVNQRLEIQQSDHTVPVIVEDRAHVYFHAGIFANRKKVFDRPVEGIPSTVDFSFKYTPTPVTLFRYSALMFNAHHIHLDKEYCLKVEGYPERLVHGPLTAQMLLETVTFHMPGLKISEFEYRATNPLFVNTELTINAKWTDKQTIKVWCQNNDGIVGMTGTVTIV